MPNPKNMNEPMPFYAPSASKYSSSTQATKIDSISDFRGPKPFNAPPRGLMTEEGLKQEDMDYLTFLKSSDKTSYFKPRGNQVSMSIAAEIESVLDESSKD